MIKHKRSKKLLTTILCFIALIGVGVVTVYFKKPYISFRNQADGFAYYLPLRSCLYDRDFDFTNENKAFENTYNALPYDWKIKTKTKYPFYPYSVGPAIFWSPFLLAFGSRDFINTMTSPIAVVKPDIVKGYSDKDLRSLTIGTYFYGLLACILSFLILRKISSDHSSLAIISVLAAVFATPFIYYFRYQPLMSHVIAAFTVSLFLLLCLLHFGLDKWYRFFYLGVALGLIALVRWQNIVVGIVFFSEIIFNMLKSSKRMIVRQILLLTLLAVGFIVSFLPQLLLWKQIYNEYFIIPQGNSFFKLTAPYLMNFLFSFRHGVFTWSPIVAFSLVGLTVALNKKLPISMKDKKAISLLVSAGLIVVVLTFYINGSIIDWHGSDSFGARRIVGLLSVFAIGIYLLLLSLKRKMQIALISVLLILSVYNILFADLFYRNKFNHSAPVLPAQVTTEIANTYLHHR